MNQIHFAHAQGEAALADTVWTEQVSWIDRIPRSVAMIGLFLAFIAIWQLVYASGIVSPIIMPSPTETGRQLVFVGQNLVSGGYMLTALWITTKEVIYSFALATMIGFSLGVLVGETGFGEKAVMPYLVAIDTMPKIAFAPLFIAWLGFDISSKVALATFIATFPIVVGTRSGAARGRRERPHALQDHGREPPANPLQDEAADRPAAPVHRPQESPPWASWLAQ